MFQSEVGIHNNDTNCAVTVPRPQGVFPCAATNVVDADWLRLRDSSSAARIHGRTWTENFRIRTLECKQYKCSERSNKNQAVAAQSTVAACLLWVWFVVPQFRGLCGRTVPVVTSQSRILGLFILCLTWTVNANSWKQNIIVIKDMFFAATLVGWIGGDFVYRKVAAEKIFP